MLNEITQGGVAGHVARRLIHLSILVTPFLYYFCDLMVTDHHLLCGVDALTGLTVVFLLAIDQAVIWYLTPLMLRRISYLTPFPS